METERLESSGKLANPGNFTWKVATKMECV